MHPSERLAALVAGELSTDERRAIEAELARDPDLRAQLEAMRTADAALADLPPTELPDGAEDRLLAALAPTLDDQLGAAHAGGATRTADATAGDELAARRARGRGRRTWLTAVGGVAAAVLAVAVVLPNLTGSGDDSAVSEDSAEVAMESGDDLDAVDTEGAGGGFPDGPIVTGGDRELDAAGADALLAAPELEAVAASALGPEDAAGIGSDWAARLGAPLAADDALSTFEATADAETEAEAVDDGDAAGDEAPASDEAAAADRAAAGDGALVGPGVDDDDLADVGRCLEVLLATGDVAIPVTAELVIFDGDPAVAFGLVSRDADGQVQRREVWVLDRASCEVRYFTQG